MPSLVIFKELIHFIKVAEFIGLNLLIILPYYPLNVMSPLSFLILVNSCLLSFALINFINVIDLFKEVAFGFIHFSIVLLFLSSQISVLTFIISFLLFTCV